jgi:hypothetical protein
MLKCFWKKIRSTLKIMNHKKVILTKIKMNGWKKVNISMCMGQKATSIDSIHPWKVKMITNLNQSWSISTSLITTKSQSRKVYWWKKYSKPLLPQSQKLNSLYKSKNKTKESPNSNSWNPTSYQVIWDQTRNKKANTQI